MRSSLVCVRAFGDFSWTAVKQVDVTDFETGVRLGFHQKKKQQAFQRGMFEVAAYLQVNFLTETFLNSLPFLGNASCGIQTSRRITSARPHAFDNPSNFMI